MDTVRPNRSIGLPQLGLSGAMDPTPINANASRLKHAIAWPAVSLGSTAKKSSTHLPVGMHSMCNAASCKNWPTLFHAWTLPVKTCADTI